MAVNTKRYGMQGIPPFPWYWEEWKPKKPPVRRIPYFTSNGSDHVEESLPSPGLEESSDPFSPSQGIEKSGNKPKQKHRPKEMSFDKVFDPYQVFEVDHKPCLILKVKVICGRNITHGWLDYVDTPDPYVFLRLKSAPEGRKRTKTIDNEVNPEWNEEFEFLLDEHESNVLQITLMEANYGSFDQKIGDVWFDIKDIPRNTLVKKTFLFNQSSEIDIEFHSHIDVDPTLRYSLCLCDEEKDFIQNRKIKTREVIGNLLGDKGPRNYDEVPTVGIIGSGGGFRAMVGYSGVVKALADSQILDCATFIGGLSGSSWYISTLYSHADWPEMNPGDMNEELMNNIDSSLIWLMSPQSMYRYLDRVFYKRRMGQPISFTDIFGHLVGETLLKNRLDIKLTDLQEKINEGQRPMPLMTCVNVKADRSARSFQEWVEFSPYEIGMPKYGTFMKTELFGGKFFMGKLCKSYPEPPLHFLQGIWGSAFCILFKRLLDDNRKLDPVEMIRQEMVKQIEANQEDESSDSSEDEEEESPSSSEKSSQEKGPPTKFDFSTDATNKYANGQDIKRNKTVRRTKQKGYWQSFLTGLLENKKFEMLNTRAGRAGVVHNFMRGLSLQQTFPLSPFTPLPDGSERASDDFDGIHEMHPTNVKHLYMVDAGLTFNSPYPLVLRPQRAVDIILSFDFSARPGDSTPPFKELLLAEKWARLNKLPFPPIDVTVYDREGLKEMYIFKHPTDPYCPVILHFPLVNIEFRKFVSPGVPRTTEEEMEFSNFDIFDDPATPYSTFNFKYSHEAFKKLTKLTEFNTLLHIDDIKQAIADRIVLKRENPPKLPCSLREVKNLRRVSVKNRQRLSKYLSRMESRRSRVSSTGDLSASSQPSSSLPETDLSCSANDASFRRNIMARQAMTRRNKGKPRGQNRKSDFSELLSPREDDEVDSPDGLSVEYRKRAGRLQGGTTVQSDEEEFEDALCNSIDEDDGDQPFYSTVS